jgi:hypothetical protein
MLPPLELFLVNEFAKLFFNRDILDLFLRKDETSDAPTESLDEIIVLVLLVLFVCPDGVLP